MDTSSRYSFPHLIFVLSVCVGHPFHFPTDRRFCHLQCAPRTCLLLGMHFSPHHNIQQNPLILLIQTYINVYVQDKQLIHALSQNLLHKVGQGQIFKRGAVKIIRIVIHIPIHDGRILPGQLPQAVDLGNNIVKQADGGHDRVAQRRIPPRRTRARAFRPLQIHVGVDGFHQREPGRVALLLASAEYANGDQGPESEVEEVRRRVEAARDLAVVESYSSEHHREGEGLECPAGHIVGARADEIVRLKFLHTPGLQDLFERRRHFFYFLFLFLYFYFYLIFIFFRFTDEFFFFLVTVGYDCIDY